MPGHSQSWLEMAYIAAMQCCTTTKNSTYQSCTSDLSSKDIFMHRRAVFVSEYVSELQEATLNGI